MLSILVVDDEVWIREGIKSKLKKSGIRQEYIAEAENGIQALKIMKEHPCDIVISDICMDDMDGLKFCEILTREYPKTQKIIVSGYNEFDYAAKAIREGVVSYLLKPVDSEELLEAINLCKKRLEKEESHYTRSNQQICEQIYQISENYQVHLSSQDKIKALFSNYRAEEHLFGCCCIYLGEQTDISPSEMIEKLLEACRDYRFGENLLLLKTTPYVYTVVVMLEIRLAPVKLITEIDRIADKIVRITEKFQILNIVCGISDWLPSPVLCIEEAYYLIKHRIFLPDSVFIHLKDTRRFCNGYKLSEANRIACLYAIKSGGYHEFSETAKIIQRDIEGKDISYQEIDNLYQTLISIIVDNTMPMEIKTKDLSPKALWKYNSLSGMFKGIRELFISRVNISAVNEKNMRSMLAHYVKDYIDNNFSQAISLDELAEKHFVTSSYLSTAFKEVIGVNYLDYLTSVRLKTAKELLSQKKYKIKTISEMTGFNDQHYFSRAFKRNEGLTPKEFIDRIKDV